MQTIYSATVAILILHVSFHSCYNANHKAFFNRVATKPGDMAINTTCMSVYAWLNNTLAYDCLSVVVRSLW